MTGEISDYSAQEGKPHPRFSDREQASRTCDGDNISVAEREEGFAAVVEEHPEGDWFRAETDVLAHTVLEEGESENQADRPKHQQEDRKSGPK